MTKVKTKNEKMYKKKVILFVVFLILLATPLVYSETYGESTYTAGKYGVGEEVTTPTPSGGGGGGGIVYECTDDSNCGENKYCFENKCYDFECFDNNQCSGENSCWKGRCVKLFDIEILSFESPIKLGEFFNFTYLMIGMADINDDVEILFRIEKDGIIITEGKDTLFFKSFEEKIKTTRLFLPSDIDSGVYTLLVQVKYGTYIAESFRTIEIEVGEGGIAKITLLPEKKPSRYIIIFLIILAILIVFFIFYLVIKNIRNVEVKMGGWVLNNKVPILTFFLFIVSVILFYYLNLFLKILVWIPRLISVIK